MWGGGGGRRGYDTRAELLKQQCHTGKVASNIHRLGPKNTQKVANELKNNKAPPSAAPHRGRRFAPPPVGIVFQFIGNFLCIFGPSLCMLLTTFPVWHSCFNNSALSCIGSQEQSTDKCHKCRLILACRSAINYTGGHQDGTPHKGSILKKVQKITPGKAPKIIEKYVKNSRKLTNSIHMGGWEGAGGARGVPCVWNWSVFCCFSHIFSMIFGAFPVLFFSTFFKMEPLCGVPSWCPPV